MAVLRVKEYGLYQVRKSGKCPGCARRVQRQRDFTQLKTPWNRTARGRKSKLEIMQECREDALLWRAKREWCGRCVIDEAKRRDVPVTHEVTLWRKRPDGLLLVNSSFVKNVQPRLTFELAIAAAGRAIAMGFMESDCWDIRVEIVNQENQDVEYWEIIPAHQNQPISAREIASINQ